MKIKVIAGVLICVLAVSGIAVWGASGANGQEQPEEEVQKEIVVDTGSAFTGDIVVTSEYIGSVEPGQQVMVIPKIAGEVKDVYFGVGDTVEEGDILFEIDAVDLQLQIAQTQAQLASGQAKAQLGLEMAQHQLEVYEKNLENGHNSALMQAESTLSSTENRVEQARVALSTARRTLREHRELDEDEYNLSNAALMSGMDYDAKMVTLRDAVTQAELALEAAEMGLESAQLALEATRSGVDDGAISTSQSVAQAELNTNFADSYIALQRLQNNLSYATVTAPISGVIEQRNIDPHGMASSAGPAFVISNKDLMTITFQIPETSLGTIWPGDSVTVEKNGVTCPGTISEVGTMAQMGGLFTVKALVQNPPMDLHTGSTVKIYADSQKAIGSLILPISYVYYDNGNPYVYVARDGYAHKATVEIGIYNDANIQILSGITASDAIISTWNASLADGAKITLAKDVVNPDAIDPDVADSAASEGDTAQ